MSLTAHGFHAICFNSETAAIPVGIVHRLSFRFKHIVLLYDVDKTGLDSSAKQEVALKNYGVKRLLLPLTGTKEEKEKRKEDELVAVARDIFGRQDFITYVDLAEQIQAILDVKKRLPERGTLV